MGIYLVFRIAFASTLSVLSVSTLLSLAKIVIVAACILIVAIPEGLPLAVSIAMALSVNKLKDDNILIKNVEAIQTAAMVHDVCVCKSGTITDGQMHVLKYHLFDQYEPIANEWEQNPDQFSRSTLNADLKKIIVESIVGNSDVRLEVNDETMQYVPKGDPIEVAMTHFLLENEEDVQELLVQRAKTQEKVC